jgi:hypothetical protein
MTHNSALRSVLGIASVLAILVTTTSATAEDASVMDTLMTAAGKTCMSTSPISTLACRLTVVIPMCKAGDAAACEVAGRVNLTHAIHDVERGQASRSFLLRGCALAPDRCVDFSHLAMARFGDPALARSFLELGCSRSAAVCESAATMYRVGRAVPADAPLADAFTQRACEANGRSSCGH